MALRNVKKVTRGEAGRSQTLLQNLFEEGCGAGIVGSAQPLHRFFLDLGIGTGARYLDQERNSIAIRDLSERENGLAANGGVGILFRGLEDDLGVFDSALL